MEERAILKARGETVGAALLFFGCDDPDVDFLYRDELAGWERQGVVQVRPAFSETGDPIRFVQHRLWSDRAELVAQARDGALFFLCGEGKFMAPAVRATLLDVARDALSLDVERAARWFKVAERRGRYVTDIFA